MIEPNASKSYTFWQTGPEDGIPEPAILIEVFSDCIGLFSDGNRINLNYSSLDEFIKQLRLIKKNNGNNKS